MPKHAFGFAKTGLPDQGVADGSPRSGHLPADAVGRVGDSTPNPLVPPRTVARLDHCSPVVPRNFPIQRCPCPESGQLHDRMGATNLMTVLRSVFVIARRLGLLVAVSSMLCNFGCSGDSASIPFENDPQGKTTQAESAAVPTVGQPTKDGDATKPGRGPRSIKQKVFNAPSTK
jgi:hypothetical protein